VLTVNVSRVRVHRRGSVSKRTTRDGENVRGFIIVSHLLTRTILSGTKWRHALETPKARSMRGWLAFLFLRLRFFRVDVTAGKVARR